MKQGQLPSIVFFTLLIIFLVSNVGHSQYLETFSIPNRGILTGTCSGTEASCTTNYTDVDWRITGDFTGMDNNDFFSTDASGRLNGDGDVDTDPSSTGICFETPTLNISSAVGGASFTLDLDWVSWDTGDRANVDYQLDGGTWVTLPPLTGTDGPTTVDFNSDGNSGSGVASTSGLFGSTLNIRVCIFTNSSFDDLFIDNVSVPEAEVGVLPIELISFTAEKLKDVVALNWSTQTETENEKFEIEHSASGLEFATIGELPGSESITTIAAYSFTHESPTLGRNLYRLKQLNFDGTFEYSDVVMVNMDTAEESVGTFYPTPSRNGETWINYSSETNSVLEFSVFDASGKYISRGQRSVIKGENQVRFDFTGLKNGLYLVKIIDSSGHFWRKLILN